MLLADTVQHVLILSSQRSRSEAGNRWDATEIMFSARLLNLDVKVYSNDLGFTWEITLSTL